MSLNKRQNPGARVPHQDLDLWHVCKVEHAEAGVAKPALTHNLNHPDLTQIARDAGRYIYVRYRWSRELAGVLDDYDEMSMRILFSRPNRGLVISARLVPHSELTFMEERKRQREFISDFFDFWHLLTVQK